MFGIGLIYTVMDFPNMTLKCLCDHDRRFSNSMIQAEEALTWTQTVHFNFTRTLDG